MSHSIMTNCTNRIYDAFFCEGCGLECETTSSVGECRTYKNDYINGQPIFDECENVVSDCCGSPFTKGFTDEDGRPCTKEGVYCDENFKTPEENIGAEIDETAESDLVHDEITINRVNGAFQVAFVSPR